MKKQCHIQNNKKKVQKRKSVFCCFLYISHTKRGASCWLVRLCATFCVATEHPSPTHPHTKATKMQGHLAEGTLATRLTDPWGKRNNTRVEEESEKKGGERRIKQSEGMLGSACDKRGGGRERERESEGERKWWEGVRVCCTRTCPLPTLSLFFLSPFFPPGTLIFPKKARPQVCTLCFFIFPLCPFYSCTCSTALVMPPLSLPLPFFSLFSFSLPGFISP